MGVAHVRALIVALIGALLLAAPLCAHEIGIVHVDTEFRKDGTYAVDLLVDPQHHNIDNVAAAATVLFDGVPARPQRTITGNHVRLTGRIPPGVSTFSFADNAISGLFVVKAGNVLQWVDGGKTSPPYQLDRAVVPPTRWVVVKTYLALGFTHILPRGLDHVLFVLGIFLLSTRLRPVLWQVSAFTVAHTITLALTIYGVVSLSPRIVEPLIALSIVYVAVENVFTSKLHAWRPAVVFCFGLLHGMGFAGVLSEIGLPRSEFVPALLSFNAGVECGQLAVIFTAFMLIGLPFRRRDWYRSRVIVTGSLMIAAVGLYWSVQRLVG